MKVIAIGDTHGRSDWKLIVAKNEFDKIVFIGDYFDTHESISVAQQIYNFKNICEYKRENINNVVLLFGNHDFHYMRNINEQYSGFQSTHRFDISEILHKALDDDLLQMCYKHNNILFTHAGVTKTWARNNHIDIDNIEESINELFKYKPLSFMFTVGKNYDNYGNDITQTPIWVRPQSLLEDRIDNYIQVVGHTTVSELRINKSVILIDALGTSGEYLQIDNDDKITIMT